MKVRELIRMLQVGGWFLVSTRGSHRQFKAAGQSEKVTVSGKLSKDERRSNGQTSDQHGGGGIQLGIKVHR